MGGGIMVIGDNKGHVYEKKIVKILQDRNLVPDGVTGAGSGPGTDAVFLHNKKKFRLEIKNNVVGPDYGQKRLIPYKDGSNWKWDWAPSVRNLKITNYYTKMGVLDYLNEKKLIPNKYRKPKLDLTLQDVKEDQKNFEDRTFSIPDEAFSIFYEDKADYVQIGSGKGFFHLTSDKANLNTEKFHATFILRFRAKRHTTKNFHSYSFFATLACKRVDLISKYNIEETLEQKFPLIKP